jgi:glycine hydroxymethyltransferase
MIVEIIDALAAKGEEGDAAVEESVRKRAISLCRRFPIYPQTDS